MSFLINPYRFEVVAYDTDAQAYITAVETADGQALETGVKDAINAFVIGCKADGIWTAIKASCILAGARTLSGALVPLVGTAPTNNNFVSGDYDRKTGLIGDGTTKYLGSNRLSGADPSSNNHISVHVTTATTHTGSPVSRRYGYMIGANDSRSIISSSDIGSINASANCNWKSSGALGSVGFMGAARESTSSVKIRTLGSTSTYTDAPIIGTNRDIRVFFGYNSDHWTNCRLAFYSIGESLNLALLDSRVSTLISALAAAIP